MSKLFYNYNGHKVLLEVCKESDGWHVTNSWDAGTVAGPFKSEAKALNARDELYAPKAAKKSSKYKPMGKREMKPILRALEASLNAIHNDDKTFKVEPDGHNEGFYILDKKTKKSCRISVFGWEP